MEKNKVMMIVIIVLLFVLLGTVVGVGFYAINALSSDEQQISESEKAVPKLKPHEITVVHVNDAIAVNLQPGEDGSDSHYARIKISVGVNNLEKDSAEFITMLQEREVLIKDLAIDVLRSKTYESLSRPDSIELLKMEMLERLREKFDTNLIVDVIVSEFNID